MYKSKLIKLYLQLSSEEKEGLKKWINSPMHNHREDRLKLFNYLLSRRKITSKNTNRNLVYQLVYSKEKYQDQKFKKLLNLCVQLLEEFIHFSMYHKNKFNQQKSLIKFTQDHQLPLYATQYARKAAKKLQKETIQNHTFFYQSFQLEKLVFKSNQVSADRSQTNLQAVVDNQYIAFVLETLRFACEAITHQRLYKSEYKIPLLAAMLEDIKQDKYKACPAVQLYYYGYLALSQPEEATYFQALKRLLNTHPDAIPKTELKSIYLIAINYCVQKLNNGVEKYVKEVFELYQYGLTQTILIDRDVLSRFTYKNIVAAAIRLQEYKWLEDFLSQYTPLVEEQYRQHYAAYAQAKLAFSQNQFDKALQILTPVEFDNIFLNMDAKVMLVKIYYENGDFDALDALLISFRRFLQRKSVLAYQRQIHENMINLTTKILNTPIASKEKQALLRQEIENTHPLTEKPWLLQQLNELGN